MLEGTLMYLGNAIRLQAAMMASKMQQTIGTLKISHMLESNKYVEEMLRLRPYIIYVRPIAVCSMILIRVSDASHGAAESLYGQSSSTIGLRIACMGKYRRIYQAMGWTSHKKRRVTHSTIGGEIIVAWDADDRGFAKSSCANEGRIWKRGSQ